LCSCVVDIGEQGRGANRNHKSVQLLSRTGGSEVGPISEGRRKKDLSKRSIKHA